MVEFGPVGQVGTQLLGLKGGEGGGTPLQGAGQYFPPCPEEMYRGMPREGSGEGGWDIPLLLRETGRPE